MDTFRPLFHDVKVLRLYCNQKAQIALPGDPMENRLLGKPVRAALAALVGVGFLAAIACAQGARAQTKGEVVVALPVLSQQFDPTIFVSAADYTVSEMLFDGLINLGPKGKHPGLAESWVISPDGKQIDFKLRRGVKFHNGDPFTAEDVKFTFDRIVAPDSTHSYRKGFVDSLDHVEVVDPATVRFVLKQPWPAFFTTARYALTYIVPKAYYEKVGAKGFQEKPIGTGPFKFAGMKAGEWVKFDANPQYWGGAPKIKSATIRLVSEPFTRYAMIERGEADIAAGLSGALLDKARANRSLRVAVSSYSGTSGILFNKKEFPQAADRRVRLAVAYAINRTAIADKMLGGICRPATEMYTPGTFGYLDGLSLIPYDPAKARQLLKEAGVMPGQKVSFTIHTQAFPSLPDAPQVLEAIAGNLEAVGFVVERQSVDSNAWMAMMRGGKQPGIFYAPSSMPDDGGETINTWFSSTAAFTPKTIQVPEYDKIFKAQQQQPNLKEREKMLQDFARLEHANLEMVPLLWCDTPFVVGKRVKAWQPAIASGYFLNLGKIELVE
jgi:peptide/nickel transport system substrate-binding protein